MKLFDLFPDWLVGDGIFNYMVDPELPWDITKQLELNIMYFSRSGGKHVSSLLQHLQVNNELSPEMKQRIADIVLLQFLPKWKKIWRTITLEYNPIDNYNMIESDETNVNYGKTVSDTLVKLGSVTKNYGLKVETENNSDDSGTTTQTNSQSSFNQALLHEVTKSTGVNQVQTSNTNVERHSGRDSDDYNVTDEKTITDSGTDQTTSERVRHGNIGVTTTQSLINQEREIQSINFFNDYVFPDVDKILTLQVY